MRSGDPGYEITRDGANGSWRINCDPKDACWKSRGGWGTPFSAFRFTVPELCGFSGRAVYMDADMIVLGDVRELLETPLERGYKALSLIRTDVSVIDCGYFADKAWWPRIERMKPSGWLTYHYCELLRRAGAISPTLDPAWNVCDKMRPEPDPGTAGAKLLHFTVVPTQPYAPYPTVRYSKHPWDSWILAWISELDDARNAV